MRTGWKQAATLGAMVLVALLWSGCGGSTQHGRLSGKSYVINGQRYHVLATSDGYVEKGLASWYGADFHGKPTSTGETYNMYGLTAAHKTLPLNTWVKVTHLANGREVIVRVNDRGPFVRDRVIDLSYTAASNLGMAEAGLAPVVVQALGKTDDRPAASDSSPVPVQPNRFDQGRFAVQVGAFQDRSKATDLARRLGDRYGTVTIQAVDRGNTVFYRVQVAEQGSLNQARALMAELEKAGYPDCFVVSP